jgi:hypothetical protein
MHRTLGIAAAAFTLLLALTGIMLNHTESLGLDSTSVNWRPLMTWYGIKSPPPLSYRVQGSPLTDQVGDRWITQLATRVFLDRTECCQNDDVIVGAVDMDDESIAVVFRNTIVLLTADGEIIETFGDDVRVPNDIVAAGLDEQHRLCFKTSAGDNRFDPDTATITAATGTVAWITNEPAPEALLAELTNRYRGDGLSLERVVLDLHSGRIFGRFGVILFDALAIAVLVLACTGVWLYVTSRHAKPS